MPPEGMAIQIQVNSPIDARGGGAAHACGLARALRRRGVCASVLCTGRNEAAQDADLGDVIATEPASWPLMWRWPPLGTLPHWIRATREATKNVDAVVALSVVNAVATRLARRRLPLVYAPAALDGLENPSRRPTLFHRFERRAFRAADAVLYPAAAVPTAVESLYGPLPGRSAVCPLGIDCDGFTSGTDLRWSVGIPPDAFLILTVGVVAGNKGQRDIARVLAAVARDNWWWAVVGDGPDREAVVTALRGTALEARTILVGASGDVAPWYAAADVLVACSRCETFGLACAEALGWGLPVVLPANEPGVTLSPLADFVARNDLGRTFERQRPDSLAAALLPLAEDADARAEMGGRARQCARAHFSWDRYAGQALELLGGRRRRSVTR